MNVKMPAKGTSPNFLVLGGFFLSQKHRGTQPVVHLYDFKHGSIQRTTNFNGDKNQSMIIHHPYLIEKNVDYRVWVSKFGLVANLMDN